MAENDRVIMVRDEYMHGVPYSKGLTAGAIMTSGLAPDEAYHVASRIEELLKDEGKYDVTKSEISEATYRVLREEAGERYAENYEKYIAFTKLFRPLVLLIGGATGVGKSTIATMLAGRLGIVRIVSTDAIREVMRTFFSRELMPTIYSSSFDSGESLRQPLPPEIDPVVAGFREQAMSVLVGVRAIINRALTEGTHIIIEGAHMVPGFINGNEFPEAFIVPLVISVSDESLHKSHFFVRELETQGMRPFQRYAANFENIRKIQKFICDMADSEEIRTFDSIDLDGTVSNIMEVVIDAVYAMMKDRECGKPETI